MADKYNAKRAPIPSSSSSSSTDNNNDDGKTNWLMSLSRRRKNTSNKENNQNINIAPVTEPAPQSSSNNTFGIGGDVTTTTTGAPVVVVNSSSGYSGDEDSSSSSSNCNTNNKVATTKNGNNSILFVLGKCLKLKFRSKPNELFCMHTSSRLLPPECSTIYQRRAAERLRNEVSGHNSYPTDLDISNEYVEVPTTTASAIRASSIVMLPSAGQPPPASRFTEETQLQQNTWWHSLSPIERAMYDAKIAMNPYCWYRGSMSRDIAQKKLQGQVNGSFLVRDSQTKGCHFTLSFRSVGITLHYRIENSDGDWIIESCRFQSMVGLIEHARQLSRGQIFCYVKPSSQLQQPFPVRLTNPISKFLDVPSLQHICRHSIRQHMDTGSLACLPSKLQDYVNQNAYLGKEMGYFET